MSTVFSHIIQKRFSQANEDVATDALAYILDSSPSARQGIQAMLACCASDMPELTFKTQQQEGSIRPDMWGFGLNEPHVYIENKFWAGLTDNQPVSYLKKLSKHSTPSVLLVVAPDKRQHTLWRELHARLRQADIQAVDAKPQGGMSFIATTSAGPIMALTSWSALLTALEVQAVDDPVARSDISQLRALCEAADSEAFLPVSSESMNDQRTPMMILQLGHLVWDAVELAINRNVLFVGLLRPQASRERIGKYVSFGKDRRCGAWIGIHFKCWRMYGSSPLWVVFTNTNWGRANVVQRVLDPWARQNSVFAASEANGDYVVALDMPADEEKSVVVEAIVNQIEAMYHQMPIREQPAKAEPDQQETVDE